MNNDIYVKIIETRNEMLILEIKLKELNAAAILELEKNGETFHDTISGKRIELINRKGTKRTAWAEISKHFKNESGYDILVEKNTKPGKATKFIRVGDTPINKIKLDIPISYN